ncbi:MAG TPA: carbohydrate binding domain-containing protein, partial [Bryobacteraceae bacterium]
MLRISRLFVYVALLMGCGGWGRGQSAPVSPPLELWFWSHSYLSSASAVQQSEARIDQAVSEGYTGMVLWDSSFSFMSSPSWPAQNVTYLQQVMNYAAARGLKVAAAVAPYGATQDVLQTNPNWAESQRVFGTQFQVNATGTALQLVSDFPGLQNSGFENGQTTWFSLNDAGLSLDCTVSHTGSCAALIQNSPNNARLTQSFPVKPWRQYHVRFWYKSQGCGGCNPNIYLYDASNFDQVRFNTSFNANGTQDWTQIDYTFNSQASTQIYMYLGNWGGNTGSFWLDDVTVEESALIYLTRRSGTPVVMYDPQHPSTVYQEGTDYNYIADPQMTAGRSTVYDLWHAPPSITLPATTTLKPGQIVALDTYSITPLPGSQVGMCLTEQGTLNWLKTNAEMVNAILPAGASFLMQYDEMRQMDSCGSCRAKGLTPGQLLAWHVDQTTKLYQSLRPGIPDFVWSD